jgi:enoyl-[acyl-carrier protein] reductase II
MKLKEGDTSLTLKELTPVRLIKNPFYYQIEEAYSKGASVDELTRILGKGRAKKGMFEGDMIEGELEIGQAASLVESIKPAAEIVNEIIREFNETLKDINGLGPLK